MNRQQILKQTADLIDGDRADDYGDAAVNFRRIAKLWQAHLNGRLNIESSDVPIMMLLVKVARLSNDQTHADSWVDIAGYAALGGEVSSPTPKKDHLRDRLERIVETRDTMGGGYADPYGP